MAAKIKNEQVADVLERIADLLEAEDNNPFRVRAYREGAGTLRTLDKPVADFIENKKWDDLKALPKIGEGIASVVGEYVSSGKSSLLDDLEARTSPEDIFARVPGIGKELAHRIVDKLHLKTLPELEEAAHDNRLETVEGFGERRVEAVRTALASMLSRSSQRSRTDNGKNGNGASKNGASGRPDVAMLLGIDAEYRKKGKAGDLPKIAPRRFNPDKKDWLPVLHTKRDGWNFTVLYSNTALAHELEKTSDWVVVYFEKDGEEYQHTVVTETKGPLKGRRVVRGRDRENRAYYQASVKR